MYLQGKGDFELVYDKIFELENYESVSIDASTAEVPALDDEMNM